jgi:hypothetical protein
MNNDEKMNALRQGLTLVFGMLTVAAPSLATAQQYSALTTTIMTIVPALVTLYSVCSSIYAHWNMKKVPENSTAIATKAPMPVGSTVPAAVAAATKVVGALLIGFIVLQVAAAHAQTKKLTGNPIKDIQNAVSANSPASATSNPLAQPFQQLADFIASDSAAAIKLSTQIAGLQDGNGQACWVAMQSFSSLINAHPIPVTLKVESDIEALRLAQITANNVCANIGCRSVFDDLTNLVQAAAPVGVSLPITFSSICSKVPQIAVVAPTAPPAAPAVAPAAAPK